MCDKARHLHSVGDTKADKEEILEGFKVESEFVLAKPGGVRNVSHAYPKNNKFDDDKFCGEGHEMNLRSKRKSMADHCVGKKSKIIWTKGLSKKFLEAIAILGIDKASPKKIQELMNVNGLTRDHVSSHLQKHRILLKKLSNESYAVQATPNPFLLESSTVNDASLKNPSFMLNQEQMNWPSYSGTSATNPRILDTESSSNPSGSLPNEGLNCNLEKEVTEEDLVLTENDIAALLSFADEYFGYDHTSNNMPVSLGPKNKDMNGQNFPNNFSFDSNIKVESTSKDEDQT